MSVIPIFELKKLSVIPKFYTPDLSVIPKFVFILARRGRECKRGGQGNSFLYIPRVFG